jgi:hypothetical protein
MLPQFVCWFLQPDLSAYRTFLAFGRFSQKEVDLVLEESYSTNAVAAQMRAAAHHTIRHCERIGVLEDPQIEDAFAESGLL